MEHFLSGNVRIAYQIEGDGKPIVLIHGFASTHIANWVEPGWVQTLVAAGRQVVMLDLRGHGQSEKLFTPEEYDRGQMAGDVIALIEHLGLGAVDMMGYSLGAMIALRIARERPDVCGKVILAGVGERLFAPSGHIEPVVQSLLCEKPSEATSVIGRAFRMFAEKNKQNRPALAACFSVKRDQLTPEMLGQVQVPILVVAGDKDDIAGAPGPLADALGQGTGADVPRRDHMRTVGDKVYKEIVLDYLA